MKKLLTTIILSLGILFVGGMAVAPHVAQAACPWWVVIGNPAGCAASGISGMVVDSLAADLGNLILEGASWFLGVMGVVLNMSIILTLNIKALYEATPGIEQTWIVIRDLSSMFIIFALLYFSIRTIVGADGKVGKLIVNIFIAGVFINFSLFFTRVLIDSSNLVSLQFYKAIAPNGQNVDLTKDSIGTVLKASFSSGGISDVFLQSLKIPKIYNDKKGILQNNNTPFLIFVSTVGGSILMITAAFSFLFAGLAFTARLAILMLVMGFSPIYFVGKIFPQVKDGMTKKFMGYFTSQLIFMPAYLLLMYAALSFISNGGFFDALNKAQSAVTGTDNGSILLSVAGLVFQYVIAFIFINVPMLAALELGGASTKWAEGVSNSVKGFIGQHTVGRAAKKVADSETFKNIAARSPFVGVYADKQLSKVSSATFGGSKGGYDKRFKNYSEARSKLGKKLSLDDEDPIVTEGLAVFDRNMADKKAQLGQLEVNLRRGDLNAKERAELEAKIEKEKKDIETNNRDSAKKALKETRQRTYIENLKGGTLSNIALFATKKAREDAAKAIEKELKKSKKDKAFEDFAKLVTEDAKPAEKSEEGGDKPKKEEKKGDH